MPSGRKKPSRGAKRASKSRRGHGPGSAGGGGRKKPVSLEEVLGRADAAMEMSDVDAALPLFAYAAGALRSRIDAGGDGAACGSGAAEGAREKDRGTLSTVLGKAGELRASNGDVDGARSDFLEAIDLLGPPSSGDDDEVDGGGNCSVEAAQECERRAGLHLYLGQLSSGTEALDAFRTGAAALERTIRILERIRSSGMEIEDAIMEGGGEGETGAERTARFLSETRRQLCAARCSIAELYLTDLCEEPDAEAACEKALEAALAADEAAAADGGAGPEAWQTTANFRLSQSRVPEAVECILKAYERMRVGCEAMAALVGLGGDAIGTKGDDAAEEATARELVEVDAASSLPEYGFRVQTAKILLECASLQPIDDPGASDVANRCARSATAVLGSLLAENDEVVEVFYLLGCAFAARVPSDVEAARGHWEAALEMLERAKAGLEGSMGEGEEEEDTENELEAIECQMAEVKMKLGRYKEEEEEDDDEEEMDDS